MSTTLKTFYARLNELEGEVFRESEGAPGGGGGGEVELPPIQLPPRPTAGDPLRRGPHSAAAVWTATALARRKVGNNIRTEYLGRSNLTSGLAKFIPRARSEHKAQLVEPKVYGLPVHTSTAFPEETAPV